MAGLSAARLSNANIACSRKQKPLSPGKALIRSRRSEKANLIEFALKSYFVPQRGPPPSRPAGGHLLQGAGHHESAARAKHVDIAGDRRPLPPTGRQSTAQVSPVRQPAQPASPGEAHPTTPRNTSEPLRISPAEPPKPESDSGGEAGSARPPGLSSPHERPAEAPNQSALSGDRRQGQEHSDRKSVV